MTWNPDNYDQVQVIQLSTRSIWSPNFLAEKFDPISSVLVNFRGTIKLPIFAVFDSPCDLKINEFPFDSRICNFSIEFEPGILINAIETKINLSNLAAKSITEWKIVDSAMTDFKSNNGIIPSEIIPSSDNSNFLTNHLYLRRNSQRAIWTYAIPVSGVVAFAIAFLHNPISSQPMRRSNVEVGFATIVFIGFISYSCFLNEIPEVFLSTFPILSKKTEDFL